VLGFIKLPPPPPPPINFTVGDGLDTPTHFIISVGKPKPADPVLGVELPDRLAVFPPAPPPSVAVESPSGVVGIPGLP
jgi:hypothetical protein